MKMVRMNAKLPGHIASNASLPLYYRRSLHAAGIYIHCVFAVLKYQMAFKCDYILHFYCTSNGNLSLFVRTPMCRHNSTVVTRTIFQCFKDRDVRMHELFLVHGINQHNSLRWQLIWLYMFIIKFQRHINVWAPAQRTIIKCFTLHFF